MEINWTSPSIRDLRDFYNITKKSDSKYYIQKLIKQINLLKDQPLSGKIFFYTNKHIIRQIIIGEHKVLYYINGDIIHILAVVHFRQNIKEKFKYIKKYLLKNYS